MRSAVARLSPVSITTSTPCSWSARTAAAAVSRGRRRSRTARPPARRPPRVPVSARPPPAPDGDRRAARDPRLCSPSAGGCRPPPRPSTRAMAPWPGMFWNSLAASSGSSSLGAADDRLGQRMLRRALDRGDQPQELALVESVDDDVRHLGLALGQRPGLVHDHDLDPCGGLQRDRALEQHPAPGAEAGPDHDRRRGGEAEGVGQVITTTVIANRIASEAGRSLKIIHAANVAAPPTRATSTSQKAARSASFCPGALEFWASWTSFTIWASAVSDPTFVAHAQGPVDVDRRPDDLGAGALVHGQALARDHRLVDVALALLDDAVDGDLRAGPREQQVVDPDLGRGDLDRLAVADHQRLRRGEVEEGPDRVVGPAASPHLEPMAEQDEEARTVAAS